MIQSNHIKELVSNPADGTGTFIVDISVKPGNKIIVQVDSIQGITIGECARISRTIESGLNRDEEDFELEVSSPGLTQPFKVIQQYYKNIGNNVEVLCNNGMKYKGKLLSVTSDLFMLEITTKTKKEGSKKAGTKTEEQQFKFDDVKSTKVILNF